MQISNKDNSLVVLTRCSRPKNLPNVVNSVIEVAKKLSEEKQDIMIWHVIIFDKYKVTEKEIQDSANAISELFTKVPISLNYCVSEEYRGKLNDTKYGTTMLVESISNFLSRFSEDFNPWVYILDDDNLMHPTLKDILVDNQNKKEGVIMFGQSRVMTRFDGSKVSEDCILTPENMYIGIGGKLTSDLNELNSITFHSHPDSAQFLIRYDTLMEFGNYSDVNYYVDFETIWKIYSQASDLFVFDKRIAAYYNIIESDLI